MDFDCSDLLSEHKLVALSNGMFSLHVSVLILGTGIDHGRRSGTAMSFDALIYLLEHMLDALF